MTLGFQIKEKGKNIKTKHKNSKSSAVLVFSVWKNSHKLWTAPEGISVFQHSLVPSVQSNDSDSGRKC